MNAHAPVRIRGWLMFWRNDCGGRRGRETCSSSLATLVSMIPAATLSRRAYDLACFRIVTAGGRVRVGDGAVRFASVMAERTRYVARGRSPRSPFCRALSALRGERTTPPRRPLLRAASVLWRERA